MKYYYKKHTTKVVTPHVQPELEYYTLVLNGRRTKILFMAHYISEALMLVRKYYSQEPDAKLVPSTNHDVIYASATIKAWGK